MKPDDKSSNEKSNGILAEYNALRAEILKRIEIRNSIVFGTLTFAGVLLGFGLATPTLALLYTIISTFLAAAWVHSDVTISDLGRYLRENLEHSHKGLYWETYRQKTRIDHLKTGNFQPTVVFSTSGVFLITQAVALIIAFSNLGSFTLLEWMMSIISLICIFLTVYLFQYSSRKNVA